jgi:hypothetical protein
MEVPRGQEELLVDKMAEVRRIAARGRAYPNSPVPIPPIATGYGLSGWCRQVGLDHRFYHIDSIENRIGGTGAASCKSSTTGANCPDFLSRDSLIKTRSSCYAAGAA